MNFPREIPSAVSDVEAGVLELLARDRLVVELGAHYGFSTIVLASSAKKLVSVDWHRGDSMAGHGSNLPTYVSNLERHGVMSKVISVTGRFEEALDFLKSGIFDGAFVDGEHDAESVDRDTRLAFRLLKKGGWLGWHDYGRFDVKDVVDKFVAGLKLNLEVHDTLAIAYKP